MKAVIQRVKKAKVEVDNKLVSQIGKGLLVLLGIAQDDDEQKAVSLAKKIANLRIMGDKNDKMNLSVGDINGEILVVSQFTLIADTKRGNRPSFIKAAKPKKAKRLYQLFVDTFQKELVYNSQNQKGQKECLTQPTAVVKKNHSFSKQRVFTGKFGEYMEVFLVNDGPVTVVI